MNHVTNGRPLREMRAQIIGVYALHRGGEIVYIGKAHCIRTRIHQHMEEKEKSFDGYSFVNLLAILEKMNYPTGKMYLDWVECWEICRAMPELNRRIPNMEKVESAMPSALVSFCRNVAEGDGDASDFDLSALNNGTLRFASL